MVLPLAAQETGAKIVTAARKQVGVTLSYDPAYVSLKYPGGDVPREKGVCTDVVIRALRDGLSLDLGMSDGAAGGSEPPEKTLSSDGATRLIVTAYIGIGNRLFIRGEGPGLSWEKGVPLQFVSIGRWRWETNDATGPVQFKLYKNDEVECAALGLQGVEPGYLQELKATF